MLSRLSVLAFLAGSCLAQDPARMDQIVRSYVDGRHFMGTVLVARGNQVLFSKGYGSADLEWDVPNTPDTKFRLGSISKQFTAASILLLQERGKLRIEDPVKKYMPDAPAAWDKITIFHVLTHTSGIPSFTGFPDYAKVEPFPTTAAELVARFRDQALEFEPGTKWNYSNSGYVLLGYLIEKITGESYEKFLRENIFTPLGMTDSGYDSNSAIIRHRASGYVYGKDGFQNAGFINMTVPFSAGALYSTTGDLLKWEQGLFGGKVLRPGSLEKMTTPFLNHYALGLMVDTADGHKMIEHGGGIEGFNTELAYYPDDKLTVVVLRNVNADWPPNEIANKLAAAALGERVVLQSERQQVTVDPALLSRYAGAYRLPAMGPAPQGPAMLITVEGDHLVSKLGNQPPVPIYPQSESLFFAKVIDAQIEFPKGEGKAAQFTLHQGGRSITATRMDDREAAALEDAAAAVAKRVKDQTAAPGSEAALRRLIEEIRAGRPDYDRMSAGLAAVTRQQLPQLQSGIVQLGAVESVAFKGVGPAGPDIYQVKFAKGSQEWRIWLGPGGKVESAGVRPLP